MNKPKIYRAKDYNFWMIEWHIGCFRLVSHGSTPVEALKNLQLRPTVHRSDGTWMSPR